MVARQAETDVLANNLANVATTGYKRDTVVFKDFPQILAHRLNDEILSGPFGTVDRMPPIGTVGTGVEVNDVVTNHADSYRYEYTGNPLHLALEGPPGVRRGYGFFEVATPDGIFYTRAGNFTINQDGNLVTQEGALVLGDNGPIQLDPNNFMIQPDGEILYNPLYGGEGANQWEETAVLDRLRIVAFENPAGLDKYGYTLYRATEESGEPELIVAGALIRRGYLEASNVNPVREMVELIRAHRAYETAAKVVQTSDQILGQAVGDVGRVA